MPKYRARANDAFRLPVPPSEENPYMMAVHLHALTQIADHLADECMSAPKGFEGLISIISERAQGLALTLDANESERTEILRLFDQHEKINQAARAHVCTTTDHDKELDELFYNERDRIEDTMVALPSTCAADFAAKMLATHCDGDFSCLPSDDPVWIEARRLTSRQR